MRLHGMVSELQKKGFKMKRTATYLRLLSKRALSTHGKLRVETVPVTLLKHQNNFYENILISVLVWLMILI